MNQKRGKEAAKQAVLRELELLAEGRHSRNQTLIARFARCGDYQRATRFLAEALGTAACWQRGSPLLPPPGWLPLLN